MKSSLVRATSSFFRECGSNGEQGARACLFVMAIFLVSPLSLYFNRISSLAVVFGMVVPWMIFVLFSNTRQTNSVLTSLDIASIAFVGYMSINCAVALVVARHPINNTVSDLVAPLEIFLSYQLTKRTVLSKEIIVKLLKLVLIFAIARALWQVFTTLASIPVRAPIYDTSAVLPMGVIGKHNYVRLFDPVSGIMFVVALMAYIFGMERRISILTAIATGVMLILGQTRSEWIAAVVAVFIAAFYGGKVREAVKAYVVVGIVLAVTFLAYPDFYQSMIGRFFTKTTDQIVSSERLACLKPQAGANSLEPYVGTATSATGPVPVEALRVAEICVAFNKFLTAPIFGHGLGSWFGTDIIYEWGERAFAQFHNSYLNLLTNAGLVGVGLLLLVILKLRRGLLAGLRQDDDVRALFCVGAGTLAWYGIFMAFQPIYVSYHLPVLIGAYWGMAAQSFESGKAAAGAHGCRKPISLAEERRLGLLEGRLC